MCRNQTSVRGDVLCNHARARHSHRGPAIAGLATLALLATTAAPLEAVVFTNPAPITINDAAAATPYPSTIVVPPQPGTISKVAVTLSSLSHTFPADIDILLVGPTGAKVLILSDAGGGTAVTGVTFTLDDAAAVTVPTPIVAGTFKPTNSDTTTDVFPAPAPAGPYANPPLLSAFNGTIPDGTWSLFVRDDAGGDVGSFSGGWSLDITLSTCGNGMLDMGEQCDDGNTNNCDACTNACALYASGCGNGCLDMGEQCDDSNGANCDGCSAVCQIEMCGNGVLDCGEQCDDANTNNDDACLNTCFLAGVVPPAPPGCMASMFSFANNTPATIPSTAPPIVVTSTIAVSGAGAYLYDLNAQTFITHTFNSDLEITLTSPGGTSVTLTSNNGGGNDNGFNGTVWDDDANPAGMVPYTANNGMATDHTYVNLVTATPLVPEEAMAAFVGENPNGVWTLTISDDATADGGSLNSWSLQITTLPTAPQFGMASGANSTPVTIPTGPGVVSSTIAIANPATSICDVNAITNILHAACADLDITLTSPAGTVVTLTTDNGSTNDNLFNGTLWDDDADPGNPAPSPGSTFAASNLVTDTVYTNLVPKPTLVPEEALGAFVGENPNGIWTLTISDDLSANGGTLTSWSLDLTTCECQVCGDGIVAAGEQCDDGNNVSGDGCSSTCLVEGADQGTLALEIASTCVTAGNGQVAVQLWMRNRVNGNASGFQAFVSFDDSQLDYLGGASSYTNMPFTLHIQPIGAAQIGPGELRLDGTAAFNSNGTNQDSLLATLVFQMNVQCTSTSVGFNTGGPFASELSFQGVPIPTTLVATPGFSLDNMAPLLTVPGNTTVDCTVDANDPDNTGGFASATDNCGPPTVTFSDNSTPGACPQERTITRTWTATDGCGNQTSANQIVVVDDSTPPVISGPESITVDADAGGCTAAVTYSVTAEDDCDPSVTPACMPASGSAFNPGTTTVNCTATDDCGNTSMHSFPVTVNAVNSVSAVVVLDGVNAGAGLTRCIKFIAKGGGECAAAQHVDVMFTGTPATGLASFSVPCGNYTSLCAKDEQHTLYDTQPLNVVATSYVAALPLTLEAGDTDNDSDVDINDVTLLITQFGGPEPAGGCPWNPLARGGDFSDNGNVGSEDYSLLSANWLMFTECNCALPSQGGEPPPGQVETRVSTRELAPDVAERADLNRDGVIDAQDVEEFERRHGLPSELSDIIKETERAGRNGDK